MGFIIKRRDINDPNMLNVIKKIGSAPELFGKASWNVSRMIKQLDVVQRAADVEYQKLVKDYAELDEKGEIKRKMTEEKKNDKGEVVAEARAIPNSITVKEGKDDEFTKVVQDFLDEEVTIESYKVKLSDLDEIKIKPYEFIMIEKFIDSGDPHLKAV